MKHIFITVLLLISNLYSFSTKAQNLSGYKNLEVLVGANIPYFTPNLSITYDKERLKALTYGVGILSQYNSKSFSFEEKPNLSERLIVAGGLYLKVRFSENRNFTNDLQIGAYLGYMNNDYVYFPKLQFKQSIFINPKTKLVIAEGLIYYLQKDKVVHRYDPQINVGLCFLL